MFKVLQLFIVFFAIQKFNYIKFLFITHMMFNSEVIVLFPLYQLHIILLQ